MAGVLYSTVLGVIDVISGEIDSTRTVITTESDMFPALSRHLQAMVTSPSGGEDNENCQEEVPVTVYHFPLIDTSTWLTPVSPSAAVP